MSGNKIRRPRPRLARGFRDVSGEDLTARWSMISIVRRVYERYGFIPLETPTVEFADMLGKFIQETGLPTEGIFSFKADQPDWLALRYDLTAPLSRYVAMHRDLPKPFRRYQVGSVFRVEKPGPGRFREFTQFDIDTVGSASNRRVLNGVLEAAGVDTKDGGGLVATRVMRCIDKLERLGLSGIEQLLSQGRMDGSGDFTEGAALSDEQARVVIDYLKSQRETRMACCDAQEAIVSGSEEGRRGVNELREIDEFLTAAGYDETKIIFDPTIVRGLTYYTGPVYEASLRDESGKFTSSIAGGGRYDDLIERFTGQKVPATGASIGVDRLLEVLKGADREPERVSARVLVTQMDKTYAKDYVAITAELRRAGIPSELYLGKGNIGKQFKYADDRGIPVAIIAGEDEFAEGLVSVKNLALGKVVSQEVKERSEWLKREETQVTVAREEMLMKVREILKAQHNE